MEVECTSDTDEEAAEAAEAAYEWFRQSAIGLFDMKRAKMLPLADFLGLKDGDGELSSVSQVVKWLERMEGSGAVLIDHGGEIHLIM